jgi:hypothetical protein
MNINDKINILNLKINLIEKDITEHSRILEEDILQEGDEPVIQNSLSDLHMSLNALNEYMQLLTNSSEML